MEFDKYSHSLGESNYHFQFTPKYRRDVFRDVIIKKACEESFLRIAVKYKMIVRALELVQIMYICFWEIAKNTVFHKLLNISKEQVQGNFVKSTWIESR